MVKVKYAREGKSVSKHFLTDWSYSIKKKNWYILNGEYGMPQTGQNGWANNLQAERDN